MSENLKQVKLMYVSVDDGKTKQSNKFYNLTQKDSNTFLAEWGRVDHTRSTKTYNMSVWDSTIRKKIKKGYKDVTHLFKEINESSGGEVLDYKEIENKVVDRLIKELQEYANNTVKSNYKVSSKAVTQKMIDEAQSVLDSIADKLKIGAKADDINKELLELYHIIPRKMSNVKNYLIESDIKTKSDLDEANKLVSNEQDTLDTMAGQVLLNDDTEEGTENKQPKKLTILDSLGLEIQEADSNEIELVKNLMGPNKHQAKKVYRVKNKKTDKMFKEHLKKSDNKKTELFWHGSRNQNWFNIISTGLLIRPSSAILTGAMFGHGVYFADKAQKSLRGSYWTSGSENKGYLALYRVHVGNQKHIKRHNSSCYSLTDKVLKKDNYDSVYAHGGADLRNNEFIIYQTAQSNIEYLVEIS
jgi:poly [ADP-ribose] polymerase